MQEKQKAISLDEDIGREALALHGKIAEGTLDACYRSEMFKQLSATAIKSWSHNAEPTQEIIEQFAERADWHLENIFSREIQYGRLMGDIAKCLVLTAKEIFGEIKPSATQEDFQALVFNESVLLLNKAEETGPDNADNSYTARAFHRLAEAFLYTRPTESWPTDDISAIAQTAATHFARSYTHSLRLHMAQLMATCLESAFAEEERKMEFPIFDYSSIPEPSEEELEDYGSGYDPLKLYKFTQRIFQHGVFRVRGDDDQIKRAIREFDETIFPEWKTREEYISSMDSWGWPPEIRERAIASFDVKLAEQQDQTPEVIANLLQQRRNAMLGGRTETIFRTFESYADHGMRCGVSANLFLALHYADANYLALSGASEEEINKALPTLTDLKKQVADYFADWLIRPLPTKSRDGRKADYNLANLPLQENFNYTYPETLKAKKRYEAVSHYADCINLVQREHPDMPTDLIQEFRQPNKCKGRDSYIAAEWAARFCGIDDWHYDGRTLSKHLSTVGLRKKKSNNKFPKDVAVLGKKEK